MSSPEISWSGLRWCVLQQQPRKEKMVRVWNGFELEHGNSEYNNINGFDWAWGMNCMELMVAVSESWLKLKFSVWIEKDDGYKDCKAWVHIQFEIIVKTMGFWIELELGFLEAVWNRVEFE